jgi:hypothetical protein
MWRIDRLEGHGEQAWKWYSRLPDFLKWTDDDAPTFIESFEKGINFGGWDGELKAIVHGEDKGEILEGHLFCDKDADTNLLTATINYAVAHGPKKNILVETPARHKTIRNILIKSGFYDIGLSAYRGRMVETAHYLLAR